MKSEHELLQAIKQNNDDQAFSELLTLHEKMIHKIAASYKVFYGDYIIDHADLYQEGTLALYEACLMYNEKANAKFSTYAYSVIRNRILSKAKAYMKMYSKEAFSYSKIENQDYLPLTTSFVSETQLSPIKSKPAIYVLNKFMETLSEEDAQIVKYRMEGLDYKEIASKMNITTKKIDNRLYRIRKEFSYFKIQEDDDDDWLTMN